MFEVALFSGGAIIGSVWGPIITDMIERRALYRYIAKCKAGDIPPPHIRRIARKNFVGAVRL